MSEHTGPQRESRLTSQGGNLWQVKITALVWSPCKWTPQGVTSLSRSICSGQVAFTRLNQLELHGAAEGLSGLHHSEECDWEGSELDFLPLFLWHYSDVSCCWNSATTKKKCGHSYVHFHAFYLQKMLFTHLKIQLTFSQIGTHLLSCTFGAMKSILRSKTERPTKIHNLWLERKRASLSHFILQVWFVVEICL